MNNTEARNWLDKKWEAAIDEQAPKDKNANLNVAADAAVAKDHSEVIKALAHSAVMAIPYALVTQLLGKIADPNRNIVAILSSASVKGAWSAGTFCRNVVVPWSRDTQNVLGKSSNPYNSRPLSRATLADELNRRRNRGEWESLLKFLQGLDKKSLYDERKQAFGCVMHALVTRLARQTIDYPIPKQISLLELESILAEFLEKPSGGLRLLAVAAALFETLGDELSSFASVTSKGINEPDTATGLPGDIMCYGREQPCLAVEVKDRDLTRDDIQSLVIKAKPFQPGLSNLLFVVENSKQMEPNEIAKCVKSHWDRGLNIHTADIHTLCNTAFKLLGENSRRRFLRKIGDQLDHRQDQSARRSWYDLLQQ